MILETFPAPSHSRAEVFGGMILNLTEHFPDEVPISLRL